MTKLAILIGTLSIGGAERIVSELLLNLSNNISKFLILGNEKIDYEYKGELIILNVTVSNNLYKQFFNLILKCIKVKKIKKRKHITHSISFTDSQNIVNILTKKNDKVIISSRSFISNNKANKFFSGNIVKFLIRLLYNKADEIVTVSKALKHDFVENYKIKSENIKVIYNFYDVNKINKLSVENLGRFEKIFNYQTIINSARLTMPKAQWHLLRIFKNLKNELSNIKLVILGDGDLKDFLLDFSNDLGLKTYYIDKKLEKVEDYDVFFLGFQKNPFKFIAKSSVFAFPSLWEGFPNAVVEAMICNIPVISSDCHSGPREILAPDTDFMFKTTKPEFAKYGILMPVLDGKFHSPNASLTEEELLWNDTLKNTLQDNSIINKYKELANLRVNDFKKEIIIEEWNKLLY